MLTPEEIQAIGDSIEEIASKLQQYVLLEVIKRIIERIKRGEDFRLGAYDKYQLEALQESGMLYDDIAKIIDKYTNLGINEIKTAMEEACIQSLINDNRIYIKAGISAEKVFGDVSTNDVALASRIIANKSPYVVRAMQRAYKATCGTWQNMTKTVAYKANQAFVEALDSAYTKTTLGATGYTKALAEEVQKMAKQGVKLYNAKGREEHLEVAASRALRTGVSQMAGDVTEQRMDELDIDLVLVSAHLGARPSHAEWQGKVYSRSGKSSKYPDFVKSTGYGTGEGLCGWNCRHHFAPFLEGQDNPYDDIDLSKNDERYQQEQKARAKERAIRAKKRELAGLYNAYNALPEDSIERASLEEAFQRESKKLGELNADYRAYCESVGLRPLEDRLQESAYTREMGKASLRAYRKAMREEKSK